MWNFHSLRDPDPPLTIIDRTPVERPEPKVSSEPVNSDPPAPRTRVIRPNSPARDLIECTGAGSYRVRVPRDWQGFADIESLVREDALTRMAAGGLWPTPEAPQPKPELTEEPDTQIAQLQEQATSQKHLNYLTDNVGLPRTIWQQPSEAVAQERRAAWWKRQLAGLSRAVRRG